MHELQPNWAQRSPVPAIAGSLVAGLSPRPDPRAARARRSWRAIRHRRPFVRWTVHARLRGKLSEQATPAIARASRDEFIALPAALQQAQALTTLGDRPLVVVTAGSGQQEGWQAAQDQMVGLSTNSVHRNLTDATHESVLSGADASATGQAILDVVEAIRSGTALR